MIRWRRRWHFGKARFQSGLTGSVLPGESFFYERQGPMRCLFQGADGGVLRRGARQDQDEFPFGCCLTVPLRSLAQCGADHFLVELGQLPAQGDPAVGPKTADISSKVASSL